MNRPVNITSALVGLALMTACNGGPDVSEPPASSSSVTQGGVEFTADTRIMESFPVQLDTRVAMKNTSSERVTLELGSGCPITLRAHRTEARSNPPAWDQSVGRACTMQIQIVTLEPGETAERNTRTSAADILGDSLPDGRYYLSAHVAVGSGPVVVPAGVADLAVPR